jgi:hypothetical protein
MLDNATYFQIFLLSVSCALSAPCARAPSDKPSVSQFVLLSPWSPGSALGLTLALVARVPKPTSLRPWAGTPKPNPRGVRAGLARTGYRLAVVKPILAEGYCRALVVGFAVLAEHANRDWCDNKRIGRVLRRA